MWFIVSDEKADPDLWSISNERNDDFLLHLSDLGSPAEYIQYTLCKYCVRKTNVL